jgi:hypothetical protein
MSPFFATSLAMAQQVFAMETDPPSRDHSLLCPLAFSSNHRDKSRLRTPKPISDPRLFVLRSGLITLAENWPLAAGYVDCDDLSPPTNPRENIIAQQKSEKEVLHAVDQLKDPRLPTGFDRILDAGPRKQEQGQHPSPSRNHVQSEYRSSSPQDVRATWIPQPR